LAGLNFAEGTILTRFSTKGIIFWEVIR